MTFAAPWCLVAVPVLVLVLPLVWWIGERLRRARLERFADASMHDRIVPRPRRPVQVARRGLVLLAAVALALAAARPQWGERESVIRRAGVDVVFVLDTSLSMSAGERESRLAAARRAVTDLLAQLGGDRVALVGFAGDAHILRPLTIDDAAVRLFLEAVDHELLPTPGSDLGAAIRTALRAFRTREMKFRVIVVLSDGEDHEGQARAAAEEASRAGAVIHALGFGTRSGEPIPVLDQDGNAGYKKDADGRVVSTRLEEEPLRAIAAETGGVYASAATGDRAIAAVADAVAAMERREVDSRVAGRRQDRFEWPLLVALLALAAEAALGLLWPAAPPAVLERRAPAPARARIVASLVVAAATIAAAPRALASAAADGVSAFSEGRYEEACDHFRAALAADPDSAVTRYNLGTALVAAGRGEEAIAELARVAVAGPVELRAHAHYNIGNAHYELGRKEASLAQYREALRLTPTDEDAKHNYELVLAELREEPPPSPSPNPQPSPTPTPDGAPPAAPAPSPGGAPSPEPTPGEPPPDAAMSRDDAERLLDALAEQEAAERKGRARPTPTGRRPRKDW